MEKIQSNQEGRHMQKIEEEWKRTLNRMEEIRSTGGFSALSTKHSDEVKEMVSHEGECVFCMDGRVAPKENGVAIAGSGILIKDDPVARDLLVQALRAQGIRKVFLHENCGAVGLYASIKGISQDRAQEEAQTWAKELTRLLGGNDEKTETLPVDLDFHNEQLVYVTLSEHFCLKNAPDFPTGFQVDAGVVSFANVLAQVKVAIDIALGHHGFGDRFTEKNPFTVVVAARNEEELKTIQNQSDLVQLVSKHDGRVVIDGFIASA